MRWGISLLPVTQRVGNNGDRSRKRNGASLIAFAAAASPEKGDVPRGAEQNRHPEMPCASSW
jgi:hypothetical protein